MSQYRVRSFLAGTFFVYFLLPFLTFLLSVVAGRTIPFVGDIVLFCILLLLALTIRSNVRVDKFDLINLLLIISMVPFCLINAGFLGSLFSVAEIRYVFYIPILFFLIRLTIVSREDVDAIFDVLRKILLIHVVLVVLEFLFINFSPFGEAFVSRTLLVYVGKERIYDPIFGSLLKSSGLFPGSGNGSIGAAFFLLICINRKKIFSIQFVIGVLSFFFTLTLTGILILVAGFFLIKRKKVKLWHIIFAVIGMIVLLYFSAEITNFRSGGVSGDAVVDINDLGTGFLYLISFQRFLEAAGIGPFHFSGSANSLIENAAGPVGEVYLLRVGIYFGIITMVVFLIWLLLLLIQIFRSRHGEEKLAYFVALMILAASLHYPSINAIPIYILLPLMTVAGGIIKNASPA